MKKVIFQVLLIVFLASACVCTVLLARHILQLPFRPTNDTLHESDATFNLDFLIPAGTHLNETITVGEVLEIRMKKVRPLDQRILRSLSALIPVRYRYLADGLLFILWSFLFMTFLRVFSFMGYGRALRVSLLLGGLTYYFMPDFSPGRTDDILFIAIPVLIIILRFYFVRTAIQK
jgi:hypothetical protein